MEFDTRPVDATNWSDLEYLFESRGGPHPCWCTVWRVNEFKTSLPGKAGKKESLKQRVLRGTPVGLLLYDDAEPVAWCSVAPRDTFRRLGGDELLEDVWSLVCFFIKRPYRGKGITKRLINAASEYAANCGAKYLEAFPVAPDSPSYQWMGQVRVFEELGFRHIGHAGTRRNVMLLDLA